jgi:hypothetical protein
MIKFLGNCSHIIDWDDVIANLERCDYTSDPGPFSGPEHKEGDDIPLLDEVVALWKKAGYRSTLEGGTVEWDMFFPGDHFDKSVVDKFVEFYKIEKYDSAWISRLNPGKFSPWHWDVNNEEEKMLALPDRPRWHCHISKPAFGHVFVCEEHVFYGKQQGDAFEWDNRRRWHAGSNCGLVPKYQFNLW